MVQSARVEAVKKFASEHSKDEKWKQVQDMDDLTIYNAVKHTQSEPGAIRKVARMIGSKEGADLELPAPTQTQAQAEAEQILLKIGGETPAADPYDTPEGHAAPATELRGGMARQATRRKATRPKASANGDKLVSS